MGNLGFNELIVMVVAIPLVIILPMFIAYRIGKNNGRLEEMRRQELMKAKANFGEG